MHSAIKKVGVYNINIKLHAEVTCELQINVATSIENAKLQKDEMNKSQKTDQANEGNDNKKDEILLESKEDNTQQKSAKTDIDKSESKEAAVDKKNKIKKR